MLDCAFKRQGDGVERPRGLQFGQRLIAPVHEADIQAVRGMGQRLHDPLAVRNDGRRCRQVRRGQAGLQDLAVFGVPGREQVKVVALPAEAGDFIFQRRNSFPTGYARQKIRQWR